MKINKEKLEALSRLSDTELWREVRKMAGGYGIKLPEESPRTEELSRLRALLNSDNISLSDAAKLVNEYRRKNGI